MNLILAILLMGVTFICGYVFNRYTELKRKKESVTTTLIESRLADCSDLTTCNMIYVDLVKYEKGSIPLVTKKSFSMIYQANIRAGIDLSKADVTVSPSTVTITLPETEVQSIEVDTSTLRFYDERLALFNWSNKEDISSAIAAARSRPRSSSICTMRCSRVSFSFCESFKASMTMASPSMSLEAAKRTGMSARWAWSSMRCMMLWRQRCTAPPWSSLSQKS